MPRSSGRRRPVRPAGMLAPSLPLWPSPQPAPSREPSQKLICTSQSRDPWCLCRAWLRSARVGTGWAGVLLVVSKEGPAGNLGTAGVEGQGCEGDHTPAGARRCARGLANTQGSVLSKPRPGTGPRGQERSGSPRGCDRPMPPSVSGPLRGVLASLGGGARTLQPPSWSLETFTPPQPLCANPAPSKPSRAHAPLGLAPLLAGVRGCGEVRAVWPGWVLRTRPLAALTSAPAQLSHLAGSKRDRAPAHPSRYHAEQSGLGTQRSPGNQPKPGPVQ